MAHYKHWLKWKLTLLLLEETAVKGKAGEKLTFKFIPICNLK